MTPSASNHLFLAVLVAVCGLVGSSLAMGDGWFYFDPVKLEASIRVDAARRHYSSDGTEQDVRWETGLRLTQTGFVLDPGIAWFAIDVEPTYSRQSAKKSEKNGDSGVAEDFNGKSMNYSLQAELLRDSGLPFKGSFNASRGTSINSGKLGSRYKNTVETLGARIGWTNRAFPMSLAYTENAIKQDSLLARRDYEVRSQRDDLIKTWTLDGHSSKTDLLIERQALADRRKFGPFSYDQDHASLSHRFPWGRDSLLRSYLTYYKRRGFNGSTRFQIDETASITHTDHLTSQTRYRFNVVEQSLKTREHYGEFTMRHQLYENLFTSVAVGGRDRQADRLDETAWKTALQSQYSKANFFGVGVSAGAGVNYQETNRDSSQLFSEITDESYTVPASLAVLLNQRFIQTPTVVVTNADNTFVYTEGFDYIVTELDNNFTQLQILLGGRIGSGETILVSYRSQPVPSQHYSTTTTSFNLVVNMGWLTASHNHHQTQNKLLSGAGLPFLKDELSDVTNVDVRWKMKTVDAEAGATRQYRKFDSFKSTNYIFRQNLSGLLAKNAQWHLNMAESLAKSNTYKSNTYSLSLSVNWLPATYLSVRSRLGAWRTIEKNSLAGYLDRETTYLNYGVAAQWQYRLVRLDMEYQHNANDVNLKGRDSTRNTDDRIMIHIIRRFR